MSRKSYIKKTTLLMLHNIKMSNFLFHPYLKRSLPMPSCLLTTSTVLPLYCHGPPFNLHTASGRLSNVKFDCQCACTALDDTDFDFPKVNKDRYCIYNKHLFAMKNFLVFLFLKWSFSLHCKSFKKLSTSIKTSLMD